MLSLSILSFFFSLFCLFSFFKVKNILKGTRWKQRPKSKQKRKKWLREKNMLLQKGKKYLSRSIIFFFAIILFAVTAVYTRYYQLTTLPNNDSKIVVQGYLWTSELEKELKTISEGGSVEKIYPQFKEVSSLLASNGVQPISIGMSEEGTKLLKRYYSSMKSVGSNLSYLRPEQLEDKETIATYLKDIDKLKQRQSDVFKYFKVNESALKQKN
ncbi:hypothetical protein ACYSNW_08495 [Enterococcus sp. LJL99]